MGRLRKVSHQDVPLVSSLESADSVGETFVPNDFAEDGSYPMSPDLSGDEGGFGKARQSLVFLLVVLEIAIVATENPATFE